MVYYIMIDGREVGPMDLRQVLAYSVTEQTPVRNNPADPWRPLFTYPELMEALKGSQNASYATTDKDKITAGVLALLLGSLGVHYFYLGKTTAGILTILLTIVTCGLWGIIPFVQGILMLTMTQQEFERKYVNNPATFPLF